MAHSISGVKPQYNNRLVLADGRHLGFSVVGDLATTPLFFFHGIPGSRLSARLAANVAADAGVCIVTPDRPGFGLSDPSAERTILDWPDDVAQLADSLQLPRFGLVALSGGTPYLAACSRNLHSRITFAAIISGVGPLETSDRREELAGLNRLLLRMTHSSPRLAGALLNCLARLARSSPSALYRVARSSFSLPDREILDRPAVRRLLEDDLRESFLQGPQAVRHEANLLLRPWGFDLAEIEIGIDLWHGEEDLNVPISAARSLAASLPLCRPRFLPGEGHLLIVNRLQEILADILP